MDKLLTEDCHHLAGGSIFTLNKNNKRRSDTHAEKSTLTFQNVADEVQVRADVLDLVEAGQSLDGNILVAVHLRVEVQVAAKVLPVEGERRTISIEECLERLQRLRHVAHDG